jgi:hypothetical protein
MHGVGRVGNAADSGLWIAMLEKVVNRNKTERKKENCPHGVVWTREKQLIGTGKGCGFQDRPACSITIGVETSKCARCKTITYCSRIR